MEDAISLAKQHTMAKSGMSLDCKFCPCEKVRRVCLDKECEFCYVRVVQLEILYLD